MGWLTAAVVLVTLSLLVFAGGLRGPAVAVTAAEDGVIRWLAGLRPPGLLPAMRALAALGSWMAVNLLLWGLLLALVVRRRLRHLLVMLLVWIVQGFIIAAVLAPLLHRPRPFGVEFRTGWTAWALPSAQLAALSVALLGVLYTLVPEGRWRQNGKWVATAFVALVAIAHVYLGIEAPTDILVGVAVGVATGLLGFRWFAPSAVFPVTYRRGRTAHLDVGGVRGQAIRQALHDQLGVIVEDVRPFGLAGSAGSTPLRITVKGDPPTTLFGKLYARSHLRADRWYKLGRELLYGRLEDEKPFNTVRRLVQQEDYALQKLYLAGLPTPRPYGVVELTPEREYLLVSEFFEGAVELGDAEVDDRVIDDGLSIIRKLWDAGLAHRDIKPANLLVRDGRMLLIDVAFVEVRPSPWRQAVDLANMMLCLGLRSSAARVYQRALRQFSVEEITEGFAAARGLALPSQLRRMLRTQGTSEADGTDWASSHNGSSSSQSRLVRFSRVVLRSLLTSTTGAATASSAASGSTSSSRPIRRAPGTAGRCSRSPSTRPARWWCGSTPPATPPGRSSSPPTGPGPGATSGPGGADPTSWPPGTPCSPAAASPPSSTRPTPPTPWPTRRGPWSTSPPGRRSSRRWSGARTAGSASTRRRSSGRYLRLATSSGAPAAARSRWSSAPLTAARAGQPGRTTQRNPRWEVPVSTAWAMRAAGR